MINENMPFVIEYYESNVAISKSLKQGGHPISLISRTLQDKNYITQLLK